MTTTSAAIHDAYSDVLPRVTLADVIASARARAVERLDDDDVLDAFVGLQASTARILAHGAADRAELDALARMCDVPRTVLAFDVSDARA